MMRGFRSLVLLIAPVVTAAVITGCAPEPVKQTTTYVPPVVVVPPTQEQSIDLQTDLVKMNPGARLGRVAGVRDDTAAVQGIPVAEVPNLASIQFTDGRGMGIANGTVKQAPAGDILLVNDCIATSGGRMPAKGDVAIFLPSPK